MEYFTHWRTAIGSDPAKFFKSTLYKNQHLLLGINCLDPGQVQRVHTHDGQDKFYFVLEGEGEFTVSNEVRRVGTGTVVWAPAGEPHGVANAGEQRLSLLVGIAPAPGG